MRFSASMLFAVAISVVTGAALSTQATSALHSSTPTLPAPGTYKIDPDHSFAYFGARHHIVGLVRGRFDKVTGTITASSNPAESRLDVTIATYSISTQNTERDDDLRSPDFFDVDKFPTMTYHGRGIHPASERLWSMDGSLTIRGISKVVPLAFTFNGIFPDTKPGKPARVAFHGTAATKRADFAMTRDNLMELGSSFSGPDVEIEVDVEADATTSK